MSLHRRVTLIALVCATFMLGGSIVASAEVISNVRVELGPFTMFNNPCDPSDGPLTVTVIEHRLTRVDSNGTTVLHVNAYGTAVSANGTAYQIVRSASLVTEGGVVTTEIFVRRISHGEGDNSLISISGIGTTTTTTRCVG